MSRARGSKPLDELRLARLHQVRNTPPRSPPHWHIFSISKATPWACSLSTSRFANTCQRGIARASAAAHARPGKEPAGGQTDLAEPLRRIAEIVRKRGMIVLISDFLAPVDELERNLGRLTAAGHEVVIFQVLDPNELEFHFDRAMLFQDVESGKEFYLEPLHRAFGIPATPSSPLRRRGQRLPQARLHVSSPRHEPASGTGTV